MAMQKDGVRRSTFGYAGDADFELDLKRQALCEHGEPWIGLAELPVAGHHNALNALAAFALCRAVGLAPAPLAAGLRGFKGLPHRLEQVAIAGGVTFFDDSKGTNVGATAAALNGMSTSVVLIAGGDGKEQDFSPLAEPVRKRAKAVVLIGKDARLIESAIASARVSITHAGSMQEAVDAAYRLAAPGDAVLLSPACASFDMFRNYHHRGQVFAECARALAAQIGSGGQHAV